MRSFRLFETSTSWREIDYKVPAQLMIQDGVGLPYAFTITSQIEYNIEPQSDYTTSIIYYGKLAGLSSSNTTNEILTRYPNIYLYGCLWVLNQWAEDIEEEQKYYAKFIKAIAGANAAENEGNLGVAPQRRINGRTP